MEDEGPVLSREASGEGEPSQRYHWAPGRTGKVGLGVCGCLLVMAQSDKFAHKRLVCALPVCTPTPFLFLFYLFILHTHLEYPKKKHCSPLEAEFGTWSSLCFSCWSIICYETGMHQRTSLWLFLEVWNGSMEQETKTVGMCLFKDSLTKWMSTTSKWTPLKGQPCFQDIIVVCLGPSSSVCQHFLKFTRLL